MADDERRHWPTMYMYKLYLLDLWGAFNQASHASQLRYILQLATLVGHHLVK